MHVCVKKSYNCCKCIRTMVALDSIDKLDNFKDVFDIDYYNNNKKYYFDEVIKMYNSKDLFILEFIDKIANKYKDNVAFKKIKLWYN